ncbi:MAG: TetR/AcrR family transcriptional regulator [Thermoleophilaceae bacterium]
MTTRSPGRPRNEEARRSILRAVVRLIETDGYGAVTMEGLARAAGVSKQTLYRWWSGKAEIVLEALNEGAAALAPAKHSGPMEADLRTFVRQSVAGAKANAGLLAGLMAEAQVDDAFAPSFREEFLARRRAVLRDLLESARGRDELSDGTDIDFLAEIVFATLWYRLLGTHAPLDRRFADELTDAVLALARSAR